MDKWIIFFLSAFAIGSKIFQNNHAPAITEKQDSLTAIPYYPLRDKKDLDIFIKHVNNARVVLLGESTHGTHEFYEWRFAISKRLIEEKGFNFIAIEGDWLDSYKVDQFIKGSLQDSGAIVRLLLQYDRWPSSMWGNYEVVSLVQWLNAYNQNKSADHKIGFYGLDLFGFWKWTEERMDTVDTSIINAARQVKQCFAPYLNDALRYSDAVRKSKVNCSAGTEGFWNLIQKLKIDKRSNDERAFVLQQQALLTFQAERYFRSLVTNRVQSWNIRDNYIAETIKRLLNFHGRNAKAIIWVHNSHAGDAHYSNMAATGHTSVGEILRKEFNRKKIFIAGFGTYEGIVLAAHNWDAPLQKLPVPPARVGSWEYMLHQAGAGNKIILSNDIRNNGSLNKWIPFRSIGIAYTEAVYGYSIIPNRFDAFIFIDSTTAVHPIEKLLKEK